MSQTRQSALLHDLLSEHLFTRIMAFMEFKSRWSFVVCAEFVISVIVAVNAFDITFTTQRTIFTNKMLCALENPNLVLQKVRYKQVCLLLCQGDPRCANVNWKAPSTCEIIFTMQEFSEMSRIVSTSVKVRNSISMMNVLLPLHHRLQAEAWLSVIHIAVIVVLFYILCLVSLTFCCYYFFALRFSPNLRARMRAV